MKKLCQAVLARSCRDRAKRQQLQQADAQRADLLQDLAECRRRLRHAEQMFDLVTDPVLIDSCVYQRRALQAQYDGILMQARAQGITAWQRPAPAVHKKQRARAAARAQKARCAP